MLDSLPRLSPAAIWAMLAVALPACLILAFHRNIRIGFAFAFVFAIAIGYLAGLALDLFLFFPSPVSEYLAASGQEGAAATLALMAAIAAAIIALFFASRWLEHRLRAKIRARFSAPVDQKASEFIASFNNLCKENYRPGAGAVFAGEEEFGDFLAGAEGRLPFFAGVAPKAQWRDGKTLNVLADVSGHGGAGEAVFSILEAEGGLKIVRVSDAADFMGTGFLPA